MSLPPVKWAEVQNGGSTRIISRAPQRSRNVVGELAAAMLWGSRNGGAKERFRKPLSRSELKTIDYRTADGWSLQLHRCLPMPGSTGEPVILSSSAHLRPSSMDAFPDRSLVRTLHAAGYDVYLFHHRGSAGAVPPQGIASFDFDDMVAHDVPAAIDLVGNISGAKRVHWIGHGLGGQLVVGHLAQGAPGRIASAVTIGSAVRFPRLGSTARRAAAVAKALPAHWQLPLRKVQSLLTVASRSTDLNSIGVRIEGPHARSILMECGNDLALGLAQQIARWHEVGHLVDRHNRFDYLAGLASVTTPILAIASSGDGICPPESSRPIVGATACKENEWWELGPSWGHLDFIAGPDAARTVYPRILSWMDRTRTNCWTDG